MSNLLQTLVGELERPRELSARVVNYVSETYGIDRDAVGPFLAEQLAQLEDHEVDLILSPVFTPKMADEAVFAELLGRDSIPREQWPALIRQLLDHPARAQLVTNDGRMHVAALREVTLDRYVYRLRLDATISETLFALLDGAAFSADRPILKAVARRAIWESDGRRNILVSYLTVMSHGAYSLADALKLLNLMESRKPANLPELLQHIPHWQQALRQQINVASGGKPFFSNQVQETHGGERDQRGPDDGRVSLKQDELEFLGRLRQVLAG